MGAPKKCVDEWNPMITEAGLFPLPSIDGGWMIHSYYYFTTTEGDRFVNRAFNIPGYDNVKDIYADFIFNGSEYDNILDEWKEPSRHIESFVLPKRFNASCIIRVTPEVYLASLRIRFNEPTPYKKACKAVEKVMSKAMRIAQKYAKEDGFIS